MKEYCFYFTAKHLPSILRTQRKSFIELERYLQYNILLCSLDYLIDVKNGLDEIIKFVIEVWCPLHEWFNFLHENVQKCVRFDSQYIPEIK